MAGPYRTQGAIEPRQLGPYALLEPLGASSVGARWYAVVRADQPAGRFASVDGQLRGPVHVLEVADGVAVDPRTGRDRVGEVLEALRPVKQAGYDREEAALDAGVDGGVVYVASKLAPGHRLARVVARAPLPPTVVACAIADAAVALGDIHRLWLVHGAITTDRLVVGYDGGTSLLGLAEARLMGIAARMEADALRATLRFRAPEVLRGGPPTVRSDIYALGVVMWEACARAPLFARPTAVETLRAALDGDAPRLSSRVAECSRALERVVETAIAPDPGDRFPDAESFYGAICSAAGWRGNRAQDELGEAVSRGFEAEREAREARARRWGLGA